MSIRVIGTGSYIADKVVTNEDMASFIETSDEWIVSRTGIHSRRVETKLTSWQMGVEAAKVAMEQAHVKPEEIDLVLATTVTPDYLSPSLSCLVAGGLFLPKPTCVDLNCACAGFVQAVDIAEKYLTSGASKTVLIVSSEMMSKVVNYEDRTTCVLFGDGAGAAVLQKGEGLYTCVSGSDPTGASGVFMRGIPPSDFFREEPYDPLSDGWEPTEHHLLYQNGKEVYKFATRALPMAVQSVCDKAGISPSEISLIFPHQANLRIIATAAKNIGLPMEKFYMNIADHGNISSACIPMCLSEAVGKGLLHRGDRICLVGFGGGLVYGACLFDWQ